VSHKVKIGVVADDVTGSNDIGIMFAKWGLQTHVYPYHGPQSEACLPHQWDLPPVCILDTNSRLDSPEEAYNKVYAATCWLKNNGFHQFFNKTCSVFRGNIGAEFDAMLDALGMDFGVVVLGFPKNGRLTVRGIHYVHSVPLEYSEFQHDPIHPMRVSNLIEILGSQTRRKVALLEEDVIGRGAGYLRERIQVMKAVCNYLILDVSGQEALQTIARVVWDEPVFCGSSALAEELPPAWGIQPAEMQDLGLPNPSHSGILCTVGSLMPQTAAQIQYINSKGAPSFVLNTKAIFSEYERHQEIKRLVEEVSTALAAGQDVVLQSPHQPQAVSLTQELGREKGFSPAGTGRMVSATLAGITALVLERSEQNRLIVAGGETAAAVCERLGVYGQRIWKEIQPGLPSCLSLSEKPLLLVLKSGSFGSPEFFAQALDHLRNQ
jgi:uncharacterized protein YgbK (DUF1537 family)